MNAGSSISYQYLWHGSPVVFDASEFRPLSHFGTKTAALMRLGEVLEKHGWRFDREKWEEDERRGELTGYLQLARLRMSRPVEIDDAHDTLHSPREIGAMLRRRRILSASDEAALRVQDPAPVLISMLRDRGYDGLTYRNGFEDIGSRSFVVFEAEQVIVEGPPQEVTLCEIMATLRCESELHDRIPKP